MRNPDEKNPGQRTFAMMMYMIVGFTGIMQMFPESMIMAAFAMIISLLLSKMQCQSAKGTTYASHAEWTSRTLKIGIYYLMPIFMMIGMYMIWKDMDQKAIAGAFKPNPDATAIMEIAHYMKSNMDRMNSILQKAMFIPTLWWVRRCFVGFMRANDSIPIDDPESII